MPELEYSETLVTYYLVKKNAMSKLASLPHKLIECDEIPWTIQTVEMEVNKPRLVDAGLMLVNIRTLRGVLAIWCNRVL